MAHSNLSVPKGAWKLAVTGPLEASLTGKHGFFYATTDSATPPGREEEFYSNRPALVELVIVVPDGEFLHLRSDEYDNVVTIDTAAI